MHIARRVRRAALLASLCAGALWTSEAQAQQTLPPELIAYPEIVLYNGKILTVDERFSVAQAVAIRDGKFLAVGTTERIRPMAGPKTRQVDLGGKTVTPGIIDLHQHPFTEGMMAFFRSRSGLQEGKLPEMNDMEAEIGIAWNDSATALRDLQRAVQGKKPGEVIVVPRAWGRGKEHCDLFTLAQLDAISPDNPIFFVGYVNLAASAMNSKAAALLKLPEGTQILKDAGSACVNLGEGGALGSEGARFSAPIKAVSDYLYWNFAPFEEFLEAYRTGTTRSASNGVTLAKEHSALQLLAGIRELWARGELKHRVRMPFPLYPSGGEFDIVIPKAGAEDLFKRVGNLSGIGDNMFRFVGIRPQGVGGNILTGGAWTHEPKLRVPTGSTPHGGRPTEGKGDEAFTGREALVQAVRYGWDVSADHTVGDRAFTEVLLAMEEGLKTQIVKRPGQLLTFNHTPMARPEDIRRAAELGVRGVSIGPWHLFWQPITDSAVHQFGADRVNGMMPMKTYVDAGLKPALEGDLFIDPPFWRMQIAITRKDGRNRQWNAKEAVSRQQALQMSTLWPASHLGEDKKLGSIEPGKLADLVVIDQDYMAMPAEQVGKIKTLMTIVDGRIVYEAPGQK